nr:PREDICTED: uncharacterized protein LOC105662165 [Megachile rotundata]
MTNNRYLYTEHSLRSKHYYCGCRMLSLLTHGIFEQLDSNRYTITEKCGRRNKLTLKHQLFLKVKADYDAIYFEEIEDIEVRIAEEPKDVYQQDFDRAQYKDPADRNRERISGRTKRLEKMIYFNSLSLLSGLVVCPIVARDHTHNETRRNSITSRNYRSPPFVAHGFTIGF